MKKEFKAPIVETKLLSANQDVMTGIMAISAEGNKSLTAWSDAEENKAFNIWKGHNQ